MSGSLDLALTVISPANVSHPGRRQVPFLRPCPKTRLFAYGSAARYRLGINLHQLPVNRPKYTYNPTKRDGVGYIDTLDPAIQPNYFPADFQPRIVQASQYQAADTDVWSGGVINYESKVKPDDYEQPAELWALFKRTRQDANFVSNVAVNLKFAREGVRTRTYGLASFEQAICQ